MRLALSAGLVEMAETKLRKDVISHRVVDFVTRWSGSPDATTQSRVALQSDPLLNHLTKRQQNLIEYHIVNRMPMPVGRDYGLTIRDTVATLQRRRANLIARASQGDDDLSEVIEDLDAWLQRFSGVQ